MRAVAIYRSAVYSPGRHRSNDAAIMDAVREQIAAAGWETERLGESDVEAGIIPPADLYLNMCQGIAASTRLLDLERSGARLINRPSSVLGCHRHRLVPTLEAYALPFPATVVVETRAACPDGIDLPAGDLWVKRGDVHAQEAADVVRTRREDLAQAVRGFADRGVTRVAIQAHVPGPVIKFYGVVNDRFFHAFRDDGRPVDGDTVDLPRMRRLAFAAAHATGLNVFGGDAAVPSRTQPMLIDLNDWPSFAPVRGRAAHAIARLALDAAAQRSFR